MFSFLFKNLSKYTHTSIELKMGRRYFCDFCDKQLPPGMMHRKTHNKTAQHIHKKKIYYQQFKGN